jgi:predicted heme/steroid binding protein
MQSFTRKELERYNGQEGARSYVAHEGKVYDVTDSPLWAGGDHEGVHGAGGDLTEALGDAPHGEEVLEGFPVVGTLSDD